MNQEDLQQKLNGLLKEEAALKQKHPRRSFETKEEGEKYIRENTTELTRLKEIKAQIYEIKFQLMTEAERKKEIEMREMIKKKYSED